MLATKKKCEMFHTINAHACNKKKCEMFLVSTEIGEGGNFLITLCVPEMNFFRDKSLFFLYEKTKNVCKILFDNNIANDAGHPVNDTIGEFVKE